MIKKLNPDKRYNFANGGLTRKINELIARVNELYNPTDIDDEEDEVLQYDIYLTSEERTFLITKLHILEKQYRWREAKKFCRSILGKLEE